MSKYRMSKPENASNLDDELAHMTDKLLAGQDAEVTRDNASQARIVAGLNAVVASGHGPEVAFRNALTRRLNDEWEQVFERTAARSTRSTRSTDRRYVWFGALAALVVMVLVITLSVLSSSSAGGPLNTTVVGPAGPGIIVFLLIGVSIAAALLYRNRH